MVNYITTYREVELNNKSRKGTYIYIKKQGEKGRYYRKKNLPKEYDTAKQILQHVKPIKKQVLQKTKSSKRKNVWTKTKKNTVIQETYDLSKINTSKVKQIKGKLAKKILQEKHSQNKELQTQISKNIHKLRNRTEYHLKIKSDKGTIGEISDYSKKSIEQIVEEYREQLLPYIINQAYIDYKEGFNKATEGIGTQKTFLEEGHITKVELTIKIRR